SFERSGALRVGTQHADEHFRVTEVARDFHGRDRHESENARILDVVGEEGGNLLPHRGSDTIGAMMIRRHGNDRCGKFGAEGTGPERTGHPGATSRRQLWGADSSVRAISSVR